jgi:hypothetical protein
MNENNVHIDRHCKHQKQKDCRISCPTDGPERIIDPRVFGCAAPGFVPSQGNT